MYVGERFHPWGRNNLRRRIFLTLFFFRKNKKPQNTQDLIIELSIYDNLHQIKLFFFIFHQNKKLKGMSFRIVQESRLGGNKLIFFSYIYDYMLLILKSSVLFWENNSLLHLYRRINIGIAEIFGLPFIIVCYWKYFVVI